MRARSVQVTLATALAVALAIAPLTASADPPVPLATGADWDGLAITAPTVIGGPGHYEMWYQGRGLALYGFGSSLGYATSTDGKVWTKYALNPVLTPGDPGAWDDAYRGQVAVLAEPGLYRMWYSAGRSSGAWQTGYATSADAVHWNVFASNPVLPSGPAGSWDEIEADGPTVIKDGALYKCWYYGCSADYAECSIGYATSPDGTHWTKYPGNPVLQATPASWDASGLAWPRVIKNGATYEMWYHADGKLGRATSPDGITWTKYAGNPVLAGGWGGGGVGVSSLLLDGATYRMWTHSGTGASRGIGYFESTDGIVWTQPVANPILLPGKGGALIEANYDADQVVARTLADLPVTIAVSRQGTPKATISGTSDALGTYRSWEHNEAWSPARPDILPGDTVTATAGAFSASIAPVGEIRAQAYADRDTIEGTIQAPSLAPASLTVLCEVWTEPSTIAVDRGVAADGGAFQCDFGGQADLVGGLGGRVAYLEPDGDMVSVEVMTPYMEVFYGARDGVGGIYAPGHAFTVTVTSALGAVKATAAITTTDGGGWWGHGFRPDWTGGDCCDWQPAPPDIVPGDRAAFLSDDGYTNTVRVGTIYGEVDVEQDAVSGPLYAPWWSKALEVWCHPQTLWPPQYRRSSATPDGAVPYSCSWQAVDDSGAPWDILPDSEVMVHYVEPDGDLVYRTMIAKEGAPSGPLRLPLLMRGG